MISIKTNNVQFKVEAKIPLETIAEVVRQSNENNLRWQLDYNGNPVAPLSPQYRAWKIRKGFSPDIFHKTGELIQSVIKEQVGENHFRVTIGSNRYDIMKYLQVTGVGKSRVRRAGFGINKWRLWNSIERILEGTPIRLLRP